VRQLISALLSTGLTALFSLSIWLRRRVRAALALLHSIIWYSLRHRFYEPY
jgi:hypothetical protein